MRVARGRGASVGHARERPGRRACPAAASTRRLSAMATWAALRRRVGVVLEVGDGAGDAPDAVEARGRTAARSRGPGRARRRRRGASGASSSRRSTGMAALVPTPRSAADRARGQHPLAHRRGGLVALGAHEVAHRRARDLDAEVEPVEQRTRQAALVARAGAVGAAAPAGSAAVAARARVHGGDEQEPSREGDGGRPRAPPARRPPRAAGAARRARAAANSASSSRNSTPLHAALISPGRIVALPPPTSATDDAPWCGARNGGWRTSPPGGSPRPAAEWMRVVSRASRSVSGGSSPGSREASIVLPAPGRAEQEEVVAAGRRHLEGEAPDRLPADVGEVGDRGERQRRGRPAARRATAARRAGRPTTSAERARPAWIVRPPTSAASSALAAGSTTARSPSASVRQSVPATGRTEPSSPSSPRNARPSTDGRRHLARTPRGSPPRWRGRAPSRSCGRWAARGSP